MRCKQSMEEPDDYDNDDYNDDDDDDDDDDDAMTRAREMNQTRGRTREASQHLSFQDKVLVLKNISLSGGQHVCKLLRVGFLIRNKEGFP